MKSNPSTHEACRKRAEMKRQSQDYANGYMDGFFDAMEEHHKLESHKSTEQRVWEYWEPLLEGAPIQ